jgi:hypothetical protein
MDGIGNTGIGVIRTYSRSQFYRESVRLRYFDTLVTSQPAKDVPVYTVNIDEAT